MNECENCKALEFELEHKDHEIERLKEQIRILNSECNSFESEAKDYRYKYYESKGWDSY